jgi:predicted ester cyclase
MGTSDEIREAYGRLIAAVEANDPDALSEVVSADVVDRSASPDQPPGLAGIVSWMHGIHAALSGFTGSVEDTIVEGNKVAARVTWRGVHTGPFLGLAGTNKQVEMASIHILRFEAGLAVEWWGVPDLYGAITQLGGSIKP